MTPAPSLLIASAYRAKFFPNWACHVNKFSIFRGRCIIKVIRSNSKFLRTKF